MSEIHPWLDPANPHSLRSLFDAQATEIVAAIEAALKSEYKDCFLLTEKPLKKELVRLSSTHLDETDHRIRLNFWREYDMNLATGGRISAKKICAGVMSFQHFVKYLSFPRNVAWMLCPPVNYDTFIQEGLHFGLERMREYLALDPVNPTTGKLDIRLMELQMKITAMLDMRKHGAFTQKIENKNLNLNVNPQQLPHQVEALTMEQMQKRLLELKQKQAPLPDAIRAERPVAPFVMPEKLFHVEHEGEVVGPEYLKDDAIVVLPEGNPENA